MAGIDDFILINAETVPGGKKVATVLGSDGFEHEKTVTEFVDGSNDPVKVSATDPMPVTDAAAEAALASIAAEDFATQTTLAAILTKLLASIAVTGTFWQATQPVSGTVTVTGAGDASAANQVTGNSTLASILAKIIAAPSTEAKQDTIITALASLLTISDFDTKTGSLTETAPATDTASSGLNGRLQRIAQRLTSLIALLPTALGAGGGLKVDGSGTALPVSGTLTAVTSITNNVNTVEVSPTTIFNGKTTVTTAGTRVVLAASQVVKSVTIKAAIANTGTIYVGNSTVAAANGFELAAGDTISLDIANLNTINIDSSINAQSVTYIANA